MKPDISEFSYGFALTHELVSNYPLLSPAAPEFPSLRKEGSVGYDVKLDLGSKALFLQFKLSDCMRNRAALEHRMGLLSVPYYRMHIRPRSQSSQHESLLQLEGSGHVVLYAAPEFHTCPSRKPQPSIFA